MSFGSFRSLALADLVVDPQAVRRLIDEGETLIVERKEAIPQEGLGPTVASFANTYGGWVLLGVADDKKIKGYEPGAGDLQDKMRQRIGGEVDPMPPFGAQMVEVDGKQICVIRVYESVDRPHIVIGTDDVFVREPGGKRSVRDHRELLQLAQYGRQADSDARARLNSLVYPIVALNIPELLLNADWAAEPPGLQLIVRATPLTIPSPFADRAWLPPRARNVLT